MADEKSRGRDAGADAEEREASTGGARRKNPPLMEGVESGNGGISVSGGVAAERGHAGRSDAGAGAPDRDAGVDPPKEYRDSSRFDLDHPGSDDRGDRRDAEGGG